MPRLSDRAILVTGAAGAIGAAICHAILDAAS
jgi:FlaA1/EpsC-like NDP-sugar epimerase